MKKLTKRDFKKMALMGIAGGVMLVSSNAEATTDSKDYSNALASKCGGKNGCGHSGDQAYRSVPQQQNAQYYYGNTNGCGGQAQPQWQPQPQPQVYASCGGQSQPQWQGQPQGQPQWQGQPQISASCGGQSPQWQGQPQPQWQNQASSAPRLSAGCGAASAKGMNSNTITQWETADTAKAYNTQGRSSYSSETSMNSSTQTTPSSKAMTAPLTEREFAAQLTTEKETFNKLDAEGKKLALKLYNDGTYADKNQAVKEAAKKSKRN